VYVAVGGEGASVVAFRTDNGEVAWKKGDDTASYASPVLVGKGKDRQLVVLTAKGLSAFDPAGGEVYWQYPLADALNEASSTPARAGDVLFASTITLGGVGLTLGPKDGKPSASEAWKNGDLSCYFSTPVSVGPDSLYMVTGQILPSPTSTLRCVEAKTGKERWSKPKVGTYHAALLRTGDGKLLMLDDFGALTLIDPDPKEYKELAKSKVCGPTWAHPALSDGRVYLRDEKELICVEVPAK
jgi:outer membrane protein assembly factor BamB